jgi:hypothetical protein
MKIKSLKKRVMANINVLIKNSFSIFGNYGKELENLEITHIMPCKRREIGFNYTYLIMHGFFFQLL